MRLYLGCLIFALLAPLTAFGATAKPEVYFRDATGTPEDLGRLREFCGALKALDMIYQDGALSRTIGHTCGEGLGRPEVFMDEAGHSYILDQIHRAPGDTYSLSVQRPDRNDFPTIATIRLPISSDIPGDKVHLAWEAQRAPTGGLQLVLWDVVAASKDVGRNCCRRSGTTSRIWITPSAGGSNEPSNTPLNPDPRVRIQLVPIGKRHADEHGREGWCGKLTEDAMTLVVTDRTHRIATEHICPGYGYASADAYTEQGGQTYVLLQQSIRGTGDLRDLTVYRLDAGRLVEVLNVDLSWPLTGNANYDTGYAVSTGTRGGLKIAFQGHTDVDNKSGEGYHQDSKMGPTEKLHTIWIDPKR